MLFLPLNLTIYSFLLRTSFPCFNLTLNYSVPYGSHFFNVFNLNFVKIRINLLLLSLIIQFGLSLSTFDLFHFLLKFPFSLLNLDSSIGDLPTFFIYEFFSADDFIFTSLELTLICCPNFLNELIDVTAWLINLLGQFINLNSLLQLLFKVLLLLFIQSSLVFEIFWILHFSVFDIDFVKLC